MANFVSASALPIQVNGAMLGGMVLNDTTGQFYSLKGGLSGNYDDTLSGTINNQSIIGALNSIAAGDALAVGVSGSLQVKGASGFDGGKKLLYSDGPVNAGLFIDAPMNVSGAFSGSSIALGADTFTVSVAGAVVAASLNNSSGGITNAGSIAGATSIDASGDLTVGTITNAEFSVDADGNTDIDGTLNVEGVPTFQAAAVFSAGIGTANAIAGATSIDGSGDLTMGTITMTGFSVDADGDTQVKTLDVNSGGITEAGAIAGASTIDASGVITGGTLTDGAFSVNSGAVTGVTTLNASGLATVGGLTDGTATIAAGAGTGFVSVSTNATGFMSGAYMHAAELLQTANGSRAELSGALAVSGASTFSSAVVLESTMDTLGSATFRGESIFGVPGAAGSKLVIMGSNAAGTATPYRLSVTGGILSVQEAGF